MAIGLVSDVPDDLIVRRVENIVKSDRQFNNAETGTEMPGI